MADFFRLLASIVTSAVAYPLMIFTTVTGLLITFPSLFIIKTLTGWSRGRTTRFWIWFYGRMWLLVVYPFVLFRRRGFNRQKFARPSVLVVNHLSFFDTFFMGGLPFYAFDVTFAVRAWPFKMFWFSPFMRMAQYLNVETEPFDVTLPLAREILAGGGHVLFFPEGHRSRDGKLGRFYSGGFRVAIETGAPVIPLVIRGSGDFLAPGRKLLRPSVVTLTALDPIDSTAFTGDRGPRDLLNKVKDAINAELAR